MRTAPSKKVNGTHASPTAVHTTNTAVHTTNINGAVLIPLSRPTAMHRLYMHILPMHRLAMDNQCTNQCTKPRSPFCELNLCELEAVAKALDAVHYPARSRFKLHLTLEAKRYQSKQQQKGGHDIIVSSISWHTVAAFSCPSEPPPAVAGVAGVDGLATVHVDVANKVTVVPLTLSKGRSGLLQDTNFTTKRSIHAYYLCTYSTRGVNNDTAGSEIPTVLQQ